MRLLGILFAAILFLTGCQTLPAQSRDLSMLDPIERVRTAYKVDRLREAKTIRLEDNVRQYWPNHEYSPTFHEMSFQRRHLIVDMQEEAASLEFVTKISNAYYHGREILKDGQMRFVIYPSALYQDQGEAEFMETFGRQFRSSGVMLAYWLDKAADTAQREEEVIWLGEMHDQITFDLPGSPPLTILIQKDTGYISKMYRRVGDAIVSYTFFNHVIRDGFPVAQDHNVYGDAEWFFYSLNRRVVVDDPDDANVFQVETDITLQPEQVDQSEMTAEALSASMYQVGQEESYTSFIKTDRGLIAFGADAGFAERLQAFRAATSDQSPVSYAVIANHHRNRMAGAAEAHAAGATLLVSPDAEARVREVLGDDNQNVRIEEIGSQKSIGPVRIMNIATTLASQNLVLFNGEDGAIVQTAHYGAPFVDAPLYPDMLSKTFLENIRPFSLEPRIIVSTESRRATQWDTFETSVVTYVPTTCARKRRICEGWQ